MDKRTLRKSKSSLAEDRFLNRSSSLPLNKIVNRMAIETAQSTLNYLNEEIFELIQNNQINESNFILLRLQKLLERSRLRFGDDPANVIFRKILRSSLKSMNFFLANYLLDNFLNDSNLRPTSDQTPDLLFITMYYIKDQAKEFYENLQTNSNNLNNLLRNRTTFNYLNNRPNPFNQLDRFERNDQQPFLLNIDHLHQPSISYSAKTCDFSSFSKLIDKLLPHSTVNQFYLTYGTSLLALVIENIHSAELYPTCKLTLKERLFQICYEKLMKVNYLDVNVGFEQYVEQCAEQFKDADKSKLSKKINQQKRKPINLPGFKRISILQQAVNDCKYEVAKCLVLKGARIDDLNIDDVVFVKQTEELFKVLYFANYKFLPANIFRIKYDQCIKDEKYFTSFCDWLRLHQTKQLPLSCLCWNVLRKHLGSKSNLLLQFLEQMYLPEGFLKFAKFQSLEILFQKS